MTKTSIRISRSIVKSEPIADNLLCLSDEDLVDDTPIKIAQVLHSQISEQAVESLFHPPSSHNVSRFYFPYYDYRPRSPPKIEVKSNFASYPPARFDDQFWSAQLKKPNIHLIDLHATSPCPEHVFEGVPFRIQIAQQHYLPTFIRGTIITIPLLHGQTNFYYVVEWCQLIEKGLAYLRVNCRDTEQNVMSSYDPILPPFILVIPLECCDVEFPANLSHYALVHTDSEYGNNSFTRIRRRARANLPHHPAAITWRFCPCF